MEISTAAFCPCFRTKYGFFYEGNEQDSPFIPFLSFCSQDPDSSLWVVGGPVLDLSLFGLDSRPVEGPRLETDL